MTLVDLVGYLAGTCTTLAFIPQVQRTWSTREVQGIDMRMLFIFATGVALWIAFGVTLGSFPVILFNTITLLLVLAQIAMVVRFRRDQQPRSLPSDGSPEAG